MEPVIMNSALRLLESTSKTMAKDERVCCLSFDEMSIERKYVYDPKASRVYGPHDKVQVVVLKGIKTNYKKSFHPIILINVSQMLIVFCSVNELSANLVKYGYWRNWTVLTFIAEEADPELIQQLLENNFLIREKLLDLSAEQVGGVAVEWKSLGEVGELVRGNGLPKTDFTESGIPAIHYGQIYAYSIGRICSNGKRDTY
mgnify:CR=1 FL=1